MKDVQNREHTALAKPLVAIGELQCDYVSSKNDQPNKKTYFDTCCAKKNLLVANISSFNFLANTLPDHTYNRE